MQKYATMLLAKIAEIVDKAEETLELSRLADDIKWFFGENSSDQPEG